MSVVALHKTYGDTVYSKNATGGDGRNKSNPYSCDLYTLTKTKSTKESRSGIAPNYVWKTELSPPAYEFHATSMSYLDISANKEIALLNRLTEQIRGHGFNALVALGESRESLATIANSTYAVVGALSRLKKFDLVGAMRYLAMAPGQRGMINKRGAVIRPETQKAFDSGDISGTWLSLKYGWLPLVSDVYEALQAFQKKQESRVARYRVSTHDVDKVNIASGSYYKIWCTRVSSLAIICDVTEEPSAFRQLGFANPASLVWEKLPFSFVFDWFVPIGDFLDNWSYLGGLKTVFTRSHHRKSTARFFPTAPVYQSPTMRIRGGSYSHERVVFNRTVGPISVPLPTLKSVSQIFSLGHIQNAAALIHQLTQPDYPYAKTPAFPYIKTGKKWRGSTN